jgi:SAM-dependent methyltransferase
MFFDDPIAAFTNIGRALRPAGRLVMMVWQAHERNEWDIAIHESLGAAEGALATASELPDPFSLADPSAVTGILEAAGFAGVTFTDVHEPVYYGPDVAAALDWVRGFACTSQVLNRLDPPAATRAVERLREALAGHVGNEGVWFDSHAWIVTARRHQEGHNRLLPPSRGGVGNAQADPRGGLVPRDPLAPGVAAPHSRGRFSGTVTGSWLEPSD